MRTITEPGRAIPVVSEVEVLVVGGGPAGFVAGAAAARAGASVALVERYGCLGGLATGGLVLYMDGLADAQGQRVVGGIPWEVLERLRHMQGIACDGPMRQHVDSELLKVVADEVCTQAGVALRLHSWAANALMEDGRVRGVAVETKAGRQAILCQVCVDASGDGDIAGLAGAEHELGTQRIGLNLKLGGIDRARLQTFEREHPDEARALRADLRAQGGFALSPNLTPDSDAGIYWVNILGLAGRDRKGVDDGDLHAMFAGELSALSVEDLSHAEVQLRRRLLTSIDYYRRNVPGFEDVRLLTFASQLGVRESRRVTGLHTLTREEVQADTAFDDTIGMAGIGFASVGRYRVPYRSLVPRRVDGLLVAGRCISTDRWTQQATRLIPAAMVTGQAAGTAAALAARGCSSPRDVKATALRERLLRDGVIL